MRKTFLFISIVISCAFCGCWDSDWSITLYAQKIEGTSKILYKYDAWGGRDSHEAGFAILDSTEKFRMSRITPLPLYFLEEIPGKDSIHGVAFESPSESFGNNTPQIFTPVKLENLREEEINVNVKVYQYNGFSSRGGGLETYAFERFKETRDSIFFYNLDDTESIYHHHLDSLNFRKTTVLITQLKNKDIVQIRIEDLKISNDKQEIISNKTYFLKPGSTIKSDKFSDIGIFKQKPLP